MKNFRNALLSFSLLASFQVGAQEAVQVAPIAEASQGQSASQAPVQTEREMTTREKYEVGKEVFDDVLDRGSSLAGEVNDAVGQYRQNKANARHTDSQSAVNEAHAANLHAQANLTNQKAKLLEKQCELAQIEIDRQLKIEGDKYAMENLTDRLRRLHRRGCYRREKARNMLQALLLNYRVSPDEKFYYTSLTRADIEESMKAETNLRPEEITRYLDEHFTQDRNSPDFGILLGARPEDAAAVSATLQLDVSAQMPR